MPTNMASGPGGVRGAAGGVKKTKKLVRVRVSNDTWEVAGRKGQGYDTKVMPLCFRSVEMIFRWGAATNFHPGQGGGMVGGEMTSAWLAFTAIRD